MIPVLVSTILLIIISQVVVTSPTMKEASDLFSSACYKRWWSTLFMVNNIFSNGSKDNVSVHSISSSQINHSQCVIQSWFLSTDFQLWLVSYIPLVLMYKKPRSGVVFCVGMIAVSILANGVTTYIYETPAAYPVGREYEMWSFFIRSKDFIVWYGHIMANSSSYFIGFLTAYYCLTGPKITTYV